MKEEVDKLLKERYGQYVRHWGKQCLEYCGDSCTCEKKIPISVWEGVRREIREKNAGVV